MESKTSPKSATWRPRRTGCVVQSKSESLRPRGAHGRNPSPGTGEDKMKCPSSRTETEKIKNSPFLLLFFTLSTGWMTPTCTEEVKLLSPILRMLISSGNPLTDTSGKEIFS